MKKTFLTASCIGLSLCMGPGDANALSPETKMLLNLLQTKGVISQSEAKDFQETIDQKMGKKTDVDESHFHSVQSMARRIDKLEKAPKPGGHGLSDTINFSGFVEVEAAAVNTDDGTGTTTDSNDINLATAELDIDSTINQYTTAHLAFLYEEDAGDSITLDEGLIALDGGENLPLSLKAGKMYVPFGQFESHFITDPLPLTLGETNDAAVVISYANSIFEANFGAFNGTIKEAGKSDQINSFVGSTILTLPENTIPGLNANLGLSYLSNLATSDELQDPSVNPSGDVMDMVGAYSAFGHFEYLEKFFFDIEYLSALDDFTVGDLTFIDTNNRKPSAWNMELAATLMPKLELALRYGGTDETGSAYAEEMYGAALLYDLLDNTTLNFEYMTLDFADNSDNKSATVQLAVEF